jgi:hypothetical protein
MIRTNISLMIFIVFVASVWVFIPMRYVNADSTRTEVETYSSGSDMDSGPAVSDYQREYRESHESSMPGSLERKTEKETFHKTDMDTDLASPAGSERRYEYRSEKRETSQIAPPVVVEHDRTIVERDHDVPPPPREGRLQAWWHRNIHRDTDE